MHRLYKPARGKQANRGLFSYLTESVLNLVNFTSLNKEFTDIKLYHDLVNIPGYGKENLFNIGLIQDNNDFKLNKNIYSNLEDVSALTFDCYNPESYDNDLRLISERLIKSFFIPNKELRDLIDKRHEEINFDTTIGVHRRATDISMHHNIININDIFSEIESTEFTNIFLMSDNLSDSNKFKKRYGNKLITYDEFTSHNSNLPFFKLKNSNEDMRNHVKELLFGVFTLRKTKKMICTKSNISSFCILSNHKLNYKLKF
tara:strand:- start:514 stop:1290 length:777 start_codon:yes stop_codon:yes gene_type:complete